MEHIKHINEYFKDAPNVEYTGEYEIGDYVWYEDFKDKSNPNKHEGIFRIQKIISTKYNINPITRKNDDNYVEINNSFFLRRVKGYQIIPKKNDGIIELWSSEKNMQFISKNKKDLQAYFDMKKYNL